MQVVNYIFVVSDQQKCEFLVQLRAEKTFIGAQLHL